MAYELNDRIKNLIPYEPILGDYAVRLDANESFLPLDEGLKTEILEKMNGALLNRYPDPTARDVCRAFASLYSLSEEFVTAGNGSDELISILIATFLNEGEGVLSFLPDFSMYRFYAEIYGKKAIVVPKDEDFSLTAEFVLQHLKESRARAVIFSNPCNPTSQVTSAPEIEKIIKNTDALVIVDEAYMEFSNQSVLSLVPKYENLVVLKTCSKAIGLAGIRLGFAVAGKKITNALRSLKSPYNVNSISQIVGEAVLKNPDFIKSAVSAIIKSRDMLYAGIFSLAERKKAIKRVFPPKTNFVFCEIENAGEVYEALRKRSIIIRTFPPYLRITAGTEEENKALLLALEEILK